MAIDEESKRSPGLQPPAEDSLRRSLEVYRERGPEAKDLAEGGRIEVRMRIRGGLPSQRFNMDLEASTADDTARIQVRNEMADQFAESGPVSLRGPELQDLAAAVLESGLLDLPQEPPSFLPDTVVGILEISDGRSIRRYYFAADPDQAAVQGKVPPPQLQAVVERLYRMGEQLTGRSVAP